MLLGLKGSAVYRVLGFGFRLSTRDSGSSCDFHVHAQHPTMDGSLYGFLSCSLFRLAYMWSLVCHGAGNSNIVGASTGLLGIHYPTHP